MSRLFKKNNSVSRVVALWLVFVMMATPFFAHAGIEKDSKAEEPEPIVGEISTAVKISATKCSLVSAGSTGVKLAVTDAIFSRYYYGIDKVTCDGGTAEIIDGSITDGKLLISLNSEDYKVSVTNDVMYCIADNSSALPAELPNGDSQLKDSVTTDVPGKYIGIYIKPEVTKTNGTAVSCDTYTKVGYYSFTEKDPFYNITWKLKDDNLNVVDDDKWYNATCIDGESGNNDYLPNYPNYTIGEIQYGYVTKGGDTSNIKWEGNVGPDFAGSNGTKKQQVSFSHIDGMEGVYDVYLGCFVDNQLVASKKIDTVNVDKKAPVIEESGLYYCDDWNGKTITNGTLKSENPIIFRSDLSKYRYYVKVTNAGSLPTGILSVNNVPVSDADQWVKESDGVYYISADVMTNDFDTWTSSGSFVTDIDVTDESGLTAAAADLYDFEAVDTSKADCSFTWDVTNAETPAPGVPTSDQIFSEQYKLGISAITYKKIKCVRIINSEGYQVYDWAWSNDSTVAPDPYYTVTDASILIPLYDNGNFSQSNLRLQVIAVDDSVIYENSFANIAYDNTEPQIKDESGNDLSNSFGWYNDEPGHEAQPIVFTVNPGDNPYYESDVDISSVKYSINDGTPDTLTEVDGKFTIPASDALLSENSDGTKITIYASDKAGNQINDGAGYVIYYKYDKTAPEFYGTDDLYIVRGDDTTNTHLVGPSPIWVDSQYKLGVRGTDTGAGVQYIYYTYTCNGDSVVHGPYFITDPSNAYAPITFANPKDVDVEAGGPFSANSEYTLNVYLQDYAGNTSSVKTISFANDNDVPSISTIKLQKEDMSTTPSTWIDVTGPVTTAPNGSECIYIDPTVNYRYEVTLYDSYGNIDESSITTSDTDKYTVYNDGNTTDNLIYLEIDRSKISTSIPDTVTLTIKDKAGNESLAQTTSPGLLVPSDEVFIKASLIDGSTVIDLSTLTAEQKAEFALGTEREYTVRVDYFSLYKIDDATVSLTYNSGTSLAVTNIVTPNQEKSDVDQMFHYIVDYKLPEGTNLLFDNITATAKNTLSPTPESATVNLIDILYDDSEPVIYEVNNSSNPDVVFSDNGVVWCTSVNEQFVVKSGDGTQAHESKIKSVKVSINGGEPVEQITDGNAVESFTGSISLPDSSAVESPSAAGTTVAVTATDAAGNSKPYTYVYYIDTTQPTATLTVNDKTSFTDDITGMPTIKATAKDTLTLQSATIYVQAPNGTTYTKTYHNAKEAADNITKEATYTLADIIGAENVTDGTYSVYLKSIDNVGHETNSASVSFTLDNTLPTVTAKITSGTVSSKSSYYYNTDVTVTFTKSDKNMEFITVKDGDKTVDVKWSDTPDANGVYTGTATFTAEGAHSVTISAQDNAGNQSTPTTVSFLIDKTKPVVSTTLGGVIYTDESGFKYFTSNVSLGASVSDTNEDKKDLNYQIIQAKPDQEVTTSSYIETSARSFDYTEEADYTINLFAVDLADNTSATRTVKFRVDKNAPKLTIGGVGNGAASSATTVSFTIEEAFWKDASGQITIYRKPGEGQGEELLKTIDVTPTAFETVVRETLTETGIYRIEFSATDRAGHSSATNTTFTIDKDAPVVTLTSADNYALTDEAVPTTIEITDDFYITKKITLSGTRTDIDGKVNNIDFGDYNPAGNPTIIYQNFEEDGIYDIEVTVTDVAGNSDTKSVHFTIDKTDPVIGDLPDIDGKILTSFSWEEDLDELVSDLTVCDVHMYLNGSEYDGESAIEDGSYTLLITAEDELGHKVEKQVSFILDTKAPVFIVTGVEDGEVKNEEYTIDVSLQLEEDTLTSVKLNGEDVLVSNNTCTISVTEKGEYVLEMTAIDEAGNESSMKLEFKYGEEAKGWLWIIIVAASVLLLGGIGFIVWKKKKDK